MVMNFSANLGKAAHQLHGNTMQRAFSDREGKHFIHVLRLLQINKSLYLLLHLERGLEGGEGRRGGVRRR